MSGKGDIPVVGEAVLRNSFPIASSASVLVKVSGVGGEFTFFLKSLSPWPRA